MPNFEKSCGAVIFRENGGNMEYLIILNKKGTASGHWGFPKGHIEKNETEHDTALREVREETGLNIDFFGTFRAMTHYSPKVDTLKTVVYFLAKIKPGEITIQESEIADFAWLPFADAEKRIDNESDRKILRRAADYLQKHIGRR